MLSLYILTSVIVVVNLIQSAASEEINPGHKKSFGSQGPFLKIDETETISTIDFFDNYVRPRKALLLKNAARNFPATNLWTDDYLSEITKNYTDYKFDVETVKKENRNQKYKQLSFDEFLKEYKTKDVYLVSDLPDFFANYINLPQPLQCEHAPKTVDKILMWFSSGNTKSVIHTDDYQNILCVLDGTKTAVLVNSDKFPEETQALIDHPEGAFSSADVDQVDYEKYPGIENFEYYTATLNKGDCLYIPLKWIHQIRSFDRNLAINFWFNYEKLTELGKFSDECKANRFEKSQTLNTINMKENEEIEEISEYKNFQYWLIRQVNDGYNKISSWSKMLVENHLPKNMNIDEFPILKDSVDEFFDLLDYNGDGEISSDELRQIDSNSLEHLAFIIEDLDQEITKIRNEKHDEL